MADELIQRLAGCWDLVEAHIMRSDATKIEPWGPSPTGMFIATQKGELSVHGMRTKRNRFASEQPTPEEKQRAYDDCLGYCGQIIRVDSEAGTLTTRVIGATNANWVGGEQLRYYEIRDDDHIVLRTPPLAYAGNAGRQKMLQRDLGMQIDGPIPHPQDIEPPEQVPAAIAPRYSEVTPDREVDLVAGLVQLLGDLAARRPGIHLRSISGPRVGIGRVTSSWWRGVRLGSYRTGA